MLLSNIGVLKTMSNIKHGNFRKDSERLSVVNYFCKNIHLRSFAGLVIIPFIQVKTKKLKINYITLLKS